MITLPSLLLFLCVGRGRSSSLEEDDDEAEEGEM
jgi:hypothetical protein